MLQWTLALTTSLGIVTLAIAYYIVLFNGSGGFGNVARPASYLESPFWAGAPLRHFTVALQGVSVPFYIAWVIFITLTPPTSSRAALEFINVGFFLASALWPFATYQGLATGRRVWMWIASIILWTVGACVVSLVIISPSPHRYLLLPLAILTALVDSLLWPRSALGFD